MRNSALKNMQRDMNQLRIHPRQLPIERPTDIALPNTVSKTSQEWLAVIEFRLGRALLRGRSEYKIPGTKLTVDGFDPATNTVYEFYGDYWHGNPKMYNQSTVNSSLQVTHGELYKRTILRENIIKSRGYYLITMWESDWLALDGC